MHLNKYSNPILILIVVLAAWLTTRWNISFDISSQQSNSLTNSSIELLKRIQGPIVVKAFIADRPNAKPGKNNVSAKKARKLIKEFFTRFKKHKPDLSLEFINHKQDVKAATQYGVVTSQAVIIEYNKQSKALKRLDQFTFIYTLLRLQNKQQSWIVFTEGHGERSPHQKGNSSLSDLGDLLTLRNNNIQGLNLKKHGQIPNNTRVLVIASPTKAFSFQAVGAIMRYVNRGGNLLWLHDPHNKSGLELLANKLGITIPPGLIITHNRKHKKTLALILSNFPANRLTQKLQGHQTLFPQVSVVQANKNSPFKVTPLLVSDNKSWNETSNNKNQPLQFDANSKDLKGPLTFGLSLSRTMVKSNKQQRIVVIGDSDFLSNGFMGPGANRRGVNLSLAMNIFAWLGQRDELIDVDRPIVSDNILHLSSFSALSLFILFSFILPIPFLIFGVLHYRRRIQRE